MPMPAASVVAAQIASDLGTTNPDTIAALTKTVQHILDAVRLATVTVPSAGLASVPGVSGGPVVGVAIGTVT